MASLLILRGLSDVGHLH